MRNDGKRFEILTKKFFAILFEKLGYIVKKERIQFNGTQDGFDVLLVIQDGQIERSVFIECKDYSKNVDSGQILTKAIEIQANYKLSNNDLVVFITPRTNFGNQRNPEKIQPILDEKFDFRIEILELNNRVDRLFAIEKEIYEEIYQKECTIQVNEIDEINRFKSLITSAGPLRKIYIREEEKSKYITSISKKDNYISRSFSSAEQLEAGDRHLFNILNKTSNIYPLNDRVIDLLKDKKTTGIILLGNPGMGKSTELKELALSFWQNRETNSCIPFYRPINLFVSNQEITDFLPENWKLIPQIIIILDGLDEISHSQEFRIKLEKFILDNQSSKNEIKFVLSCRTNIYENVIKGIGDFKTLTLDNIYYPNALKYLETEFNLPLAEYSQFSLDENQKEFLENPYYLNLFGEHYAINKQIPSNKADLIDRYVAKRSEDDRKLKYKNLDYDKSLVLNLCKKVAISLEATQNNQLQDARLNILLGSNKQEFINSCFVEKVYEKDYWKFEHRNLQEFFVAKALENLSLDEIIEFIRLDDKTNKTHPSWLNSISYLINVLDETSEKYTGLINWLEKNDRPVLFLVDSNRIPTSLRVKVFQEHFEIRCKEQTLWIRSYDKDVPKLAKFGDCPENVDFLMAEILNKDNHRRTRISALDLISKMTVLSKRDYIKQIIIDLIKAPLGEVDINFKSDVIRVAEALNFHLEEGYIAEVISALGDLDHHTITSAVLNMIVDDNTELYISYIKDITPKVIDENRRKYKKEGNLVTGENLTYKRVLEGFETPENLVFALNTFLENDHALNIGKDDVIKLVQKLIKVYSKNTALLKQMIEFVINGLKNRTYFYHYEQIIASFFTETKTLDKAFKEIYVSAKKFDDSRHFLAKITTVESLDFILNEHKNGYLTDKEIFYFRNVLSHHNFELSIQFQNQVIKVSKYKFEEDLLDVGLRERWRKFHETKIQNGFDLLFEKEKLIEMTKDYFSYLGKEKISLEDNEDNRKEYWESLELQTRFPESFINIVYQTFRDNDFTIVANDVEKLINDDLFIISQIHQKIKSNIKNKELQIGQFRVDVIKEWCLKNIDDADFNKAYTGTFRNSKNCEFLWFFRKIFDFKYPSENLLDMLMVDYQVDGVAGFHGYKYIIKNVAKGKVKERIINNLKEGIDTSYIFENHVLYALDNKLEQVFPLIRKEIKNIDRSEYIRTNILEKFIDQTNDIELLKELVEPHDEDESKDHLTWKAIEILLKKGEKDFVIDKLLKFRGNKDENEFVVIKYLMRAGYKDAFKFFNKWIKDGNDYTRKVHRHISSEDMLMFANPEAIPDIIELIKINYENYKFDNFIRPIAIAIESLKGICQSSTPEVCLEGIEKLEQCKKSLQKKNIDLFYINTMINDTWDMYFKLKSKPMTFEEISRKIDDYKYKIV